MTPAYPRRFPQLEQDAAQAAMLALATAGVRSESHVLKRHFGATRNTDNAVENECAIPYRVESYGGGRHVSLLVERERPENPVLHSRLEQLLHDRRAAAVRAGDRVE